MVSRSDGKGGGKGLGKGVNKLIGSASAKSSTKPGGGHHRGGSSTDGAPHGPRITDYGEPEVDLEHLEALLGEDPENVDLLDLAAFAYYSANLLFKARSAYQRLIELDADRASHHFYLANTLYKLNRFDEADVEWRAVERLDGDGQFGTKARERRHQLAEFLEQQGYGGDHDKAETSSDDDDFGLSDDDTP